MTLDSYSFIKGCESCEKVHIRTSDVKCMLSARVENSISEWCDDSTNLEAKTSPSQFYDEKFGS